MEKMKVGGKEERKERKKGIEQRRGRSRSPRTKTYEEKDKGNSEKECSVGRRKLRHEGRKKEKEIRKEGERSIREHKVEEEDHKQRHMKGDNAKDQEGMQ